MGRRDPVVRVGEPLLVRGDPRPGRRRPTRQTNPREGCAPRGTGTEGLSIAIDGSLTADGPPNRGIGEPQTGPTIGRPGPTWDPRRWTTRGRSLPRTSGTLPLPGFQNRPEPRRTAAHHRRGARLDARRRRRPGSRSSLPLGPGPRWCRRTATGCAGIIAPGGCPRRNSGGAPGRPPRASTIPAGSAPRTDAAPARGRRRFGSLRWWIPEG